MAVDAISLLRLNDTPDGAGSEHSEVSPFGCSLSRSTANPRRRRGHIGVVGAPKQRVPLQTTFSEGDVSGDDHADDEAASGDVFTKVHRHLSPSHSCQPSCAADSQKTIFHPGRLLGQSEDLLDEPPFTDGLESTDDCQQN